MTRSGDIVEKRYRLDKRIAAGALGTRMTGGGFGGSTISLIDAERVPALAAAITKAFGRAGLPASSASACSAPTRMAVGDCPDGTYGSGY